MKDKNCTMCKWFVGGDWKGECRRFPPYHATITGNTYPTVTEFTDVCGEFQTKETAQHQKEK